MIQKNFFLVNARSGELPEYMHRIVEYYKDCLNPKSFNVEFHYKPDDEEILYVRNYIDNAELSGKTDPFYDFFKSFSSNYIGKKMTYEENLTWLTGLSLIWKYGGSFIDMSCLIPDDPYNNLNLFENETLSHGTLYAMQYGNFYKVFGCSAPRENQAFLRTFIFKNIRDRITTFDFKI